MDEQYYDCFGNAISKAEHKKHCIEMSGVSTKTLLSMEEEESECLKSRPKEKLLKNRQLQLDLDLDLDTDN